MGLYLISVGKLWNKSWRAWDKREATAFEPCHKIMVLFVIRKFILQTRMRSHQVGVFVWLLVGPFVYFHTSCVQTAKAGCIVSPEPSLVAYVVSTITSWAGSFISSEHLNRCMHFRGTWAQSKFLGKGTSTCTIKLLICETGDKAIYFGRRSVYKWTGTPTPTGRVSLMSTAVNLSTWSNN